MNIHNIRRLNTRKKEYKNRLNKYILDILKISYIEHLEYINESTKYIKKVDILKHFINRFNNEFNHEYNRKRFPNLTDRIGEFLNGGAFSFPIYNYQIIEDVAKLHKVKKLTEKEEDIVCDGYYKHIANDIVKLLQYNQIHFLQISGQIN